MTTMMHVTTMVLKMLVVVMLHDDQGENDHDRAATAGDA